MKTQTTLLFLGLALGTVTPALSLDNIGGPAALNFGIQTDDLVGIFQPSGFVTTEVKEGGYRGTAGRYTNWSCTGADSYEAIGLQQTIDYPSGRTQVEKFCEIGIISDDGTYFKRLVTTNASSCAGEVPVDSPKLIVIDNEISNLTSGVTQNVCAKGDSVIGLDTSNGPGLNLTAVESNVGKTLDDVVFTPAVDPNEFKGDEVQKNFQGIFLVDNQGEYGLKIQKDGKQYSEIALTRDENPMFKVLFNTYSSAQCWGNGLYSSDLTARILDENLSYDITSFCSSGYISNTGNLKISNAQNCSLDLNQAVVLTKYEPEADATYCVEPTPGLTPICLQNTEEVPVSNEIATELAKKAASAWYKPEDHITLQTCGEALSGFLDSIEISKACTNSTKGDALIYFQATVPCSEEIKAELLKNNPNSSFILDFAAYDGSSYPEFPSGILYGPPGIKTMTFDSRSSEASSEKYSVSSAPVVSLSSMFVILVLLSITLPV